MAWHRPTGRNATVVLVGFVGVLSLLTGILHLAAPVPIDAVQHLLPGVVTEMAGFTGTMTGFVLLLCAYLLRTGSRPAWYVALVLLPLSAVQGLVQASVLSIPLIVLSLAAIPTVAYNRSRFTRPLDLDTTQLAAGTAVLGAFAYGTFGSFAIRDQFADGQLETLLDAFYYTVITATTVGYGDVVAETQFARLFSLSVVVFATASFAVALGTLLVPALEARFASVLGQMTETELEALEEHVIVIGIGSLTQSILAGVADRSVLVVTADEAGANRLQAAGHPVLVGSGTDEAVLERAKIDRARAVIVATDEDGHDVLAILTVREVDADVRVIAAATNRENAHKMRRAGADAVVSPADIGGQVLVRAALDGDTDDVGIDGLLK